MRKARSKAPPKKARPSRGRSVVPAFRVSPKLLVTIFAAAALVMILAAVVPLLVPTSAYRSWVETELSRYVDARVSMGRFRFQLLPYPGYTITDMELASSSAPFQGQTFLHAKKVRGSLSFLGLLRGRAITDLGASGVTVDIRSLAGATNVSSVLKISGSGALPPSDGDAAPRGAPPVFEPRGESPEIKVLPALPAEAPKGMPGSLPAKEEEKEKPAGPTTNPSGDEGRLSILIRNAHAQGPDFPHAGKGRMEIGRLDVSSGRVNVWDDGALLYSAEGVSFAAEKIPSANGFGAGV
nr:hypothetical protein [bacterium]